ncbi:methylamine utilization protein [Planctobacterium marinum]|uniref:Methylamine utilization protein n=1 Tax=Planctobacterium marinum TaxID=1631968 RepID=A0AA48HY98_9ALTE|nr:hypothetical protein MACH26_23260 [Planctobacterium marinum]
MPLFIRSLILLLFSISHCWAANISFSVVDKDNNPLADAIISLTPTSEGAIKAAATAAAPVAQMTQSNKQFNPHVVAVQQGHKVHFPNEDSIKHQVYSLSELQQFDLTVEAGATEHGPQMTSTGAINIGCNIHDWMQAYVYVVDTPWFGQTDADGLVSIELPDNETFSWQLWHPRVSSEEAHSGGLIQAPYGQVDIILKSALLPAYDEASDFDDFDDY